MFVMRDGVKVVMDAIVKAINDVKAQEKYGDLTLMEIASALAHLEVQYRLQVDFAMAQIIAKEQEQNPAIIVPQLRFNGDPNQLRG